MSNLPERLLAFLEEVKSVRGLPAEEAETYRLAYDRYGIDDTLSLQDVFFNDQGQVSLDRYLPSLQQAGTVSDRTLVSFGLRVGDKIVSPRGDLQLPPDARLRSRAATIDYVLVDAAGILFAPGVLRRTFALGEDLVTDDTPPEVWGEAQPQPPPQQVLTVAELRDAFRDFVRNALRGRFNSLRLKAIVFCFDDFLKTSPQKHYQWSGDGASFRGAFGNGLYADELWGGFLTDYAGIGGQSSYYAFLGDRERRAHLIRVLSRAVQAIPYEDFVPSYPQDNDTRESPASYGQPLIVWDAAPEGASFVLSSGGADPRGLPPLWSWVRDEIGEAEHSISAWIGRFLDFRAKAAASADPDQERAGRRSLQRHQTSFEVWSLDISDSLLLGLRWSWQARDRLWETGSHLWIKLFNNAKPWPGTLIDATGLLELLVGWLRVYVATRVRRILGGEAGGGPPEDDVLAWAGDAVSPDTVVNLVVGAQSLAGESSYVDSGGTGLLGMNASWWWHFSLLVALMGVYERREATLEPFLLLVDVADAREGRVRLSGPLVLLAFYARHVMGMTDALVLAPAARLGSAGGMDAFYADVSALALFPENVFTGPRLPLEMAGTLQLDVGRAIQEAINERTDPWLDAWTREPNDQSPQGVSETQQRVFRTRRVLGGTATRPGNRLQTRGRLAGHISGASLERDVLYAIDGRRWWTPAYDYFLVSTASRAVPAAAAAPGTDPFLDMYVNSPNHCRLYDALDVLTALTRKRDGTLNENVRLGARLRGVETEPRRRGAVEQAYSLGWVPFQRLGIMEDLGEIVRQQRVPPSPASVRQARRVRPTTHQSLAGVARDVHGVMAAKNSLDSLRVFIAQDPSTWAIITGSAAADQDFQYVLRRANWSRASSAIARLRAAMPWYLWYSALEDDPQTGRTHYTFLTAWMKRVAWSLVSFRHNDSEAFLSLQKYVASPWLWRWISALLEAGIGGQPIDDVPTLNRLALVLDESAHYNIDGLALSAWQESRGHASGWGLLSDGYALDLVLRDADRLEAGRQDFAVSGYLLAIDTLRRVFDGGPLAGSIGDGSILQSIQNVDVFFEILAPRPNTLSAPQKQTLARGQVLMKALLALPAASPLMRSFEMDADRWRSTLFTNGDPDQDLTTFVPSPGSNRVLLGLLLVAAVRAALMSMWGKEDDCVFTHFDRDGATDRTGLRRVMDTLFLGNVWHLESPEVVAPLVASISYYYETVDAGIMPAALEDVLGAGRGTLPQNIAETVRELQNLLAEKRDEDDGGLGSAESHVLYRLRPDPDSPYFVGVFQEQGRTASWRNIMQISEDDARAAAPQAASIEAGAEPTFHWVNVRFGKASRDVPPWQPPPEEWRPLGVRDFHAFVGDGAAPFYRSLPVGVGIYQYYRSEELSRWLQRRGTLAGEMVGGGGGAAGTQPPWFFDGGGNIVGGLGRSWSRRVSPVGTVFWRSDRDGDVVTAVYVRDQEDGRLYPCLLFGVRPEASPAVRDPAPQMRRILSVINGAWVFGFSQWIAREYTDMHWWTRWWRAFSTRRFASGALDRNTALDGEDDFYGYVSVMAFVRWNLLRAPFKNAYGTLATVGPLTRAHANFNAHIGGDGFMCLPCSASSSYLFWCMSAVEEHFRLVSFVRDDGSVPTYSADGADPRATSQAGSLSASWPSLGDALFLSRCWSGELFTYPQQASLRGAAGGNLDLEALFPRLSRRALRERIRRGADLCRYVYQELKAQGGYDPGEPHRLAEFPDMWDLGNAAPRSKGSRSRAGTFQVPHVEDVELDEASSRWMLFVWSLPDAAAFQLDDVVEERAFKALSGTFEDFGDGTRVSWAQFMAHGRRPEWFTEHVRYTFMPPDGTDMDAALALTPFIQYVHLLDGLDDAHKIIGVRIDWAYFEAIPGASRAWIANDLLPRIAQRRRQDLHADMLAVAERLARDVTQRLSVLTRAASAGRDAFAFLATQRLRFVCNAENILRFLYRIWSAEPGVNVVERTRRDWFPIYRTLRQLESAQAREMIK